jgi:hypothetical protein
MWNNKEGQKGCLDLGQWMDTREILEILIENTNELFFQNFSLAFIY